MKKMVKKTAAGILAASMIFSSLGMSALASEDTVAASEWTEDITVDYNDALGPTYASAYYGLWHKEVEVDEETTRSYCFYTPETWVAAGSCVYVAVPEGVTAEEFANMSSWMDVAYDYGFTVAFLEGADASWDLDALENELDYVIAVSIDLSDRSIVNYNESSLYLVGYGVGSTVANYLAMNLANMFAGAVFMGTPDITADEVEEIGNYNEFNAPTYGGYERVEGTVVKDVNIPIWIVNDGEPNTALEDYWKEANDVTDEVVYNDYAEIYNQDLLFEDQQASYEAASYVWISEMDNASEIYDYDFTAYMWEHFLCKLLRLRDRQDGTLYYNSYEKMEELTYYCEEIDGLNRYWAVYTPESYDGSEATPMLLFLHGHAHGIAAFFVNTGLWRVAEKYGFVLVFGLARPCHTDPLVDCYQWQSSGEDLEADLDYIGLVLDSVEEDYNIDESRIYCMGHSNGAGMTISVAEYMADRFAGFAPIGSTTKLYTSLEEIPEEEEDVKYPMIIIAGDAENAGDYSEGSAMDITIKRALAADGLDQEEEPIEYYNGLYTVRSFYDEDSSVPLLKHYLRDDTIHTVLQEYCEIVWDYLCGFSRGEDGTLYYNGEVIG